MNKIYKVIWNEVRHCFVCVSELAKSHHKPKSRKALAHDKDGKPTIERVRVNKDYPEHRNVIAKNHKKSPARAHRYEPDFREGRRASGTCRSARRPFSLSIPPFAGRDAPYIFPVTALRFKT